MFEFIKNLNNKLSNVLNINNSNKSGISYVLDDELKKEITSWLKTISLEKFSFDEILKRLGFEEGKTLYLQKNDNSKEFKLVINYGYEKNIDDNKKIILSDRYDYWKSNYGGIILIDNNYVKRYYIYACNDKEENDDFKIVLEEKQITKEVNGNVITIRYGIDTILINIKKTDGLEIKLYCKASFMFKIDNEMELENYLLNLELPLDMFSVYKKICEISIYDEIDLSYFELTFNRGKKVLASLSEEKEIMFGGVCQLSSKFNIKDSTRDISYKRYSPNKVFIRFWGEDAYSVKLNIQNENYELTLVVKSIDSKDKDYKLDNEMELRNYLLYLEFPIKIEEVLKKICEISLGDISKYSLIKLDCYYNEKKISALHFRNGKFDLYNDIRDGKEISVNSDGMFRYKTDNKGNYYFIEIVDDVIKKYEYISSEGIKMNTDNRIENPLEMVINDVKMEKVRTRKLIDEIMK